MKFVFIKYVFIIRSTFKVKVKSALQLKSVSWKEDLRGVPGLADATYPVAHSLTRCTSCVYLTPQEINDGNTDKICKI